MMVAKFPPPEPWPTELFEQYGVADLEQLERDVRAEIDRRKNAAAVDSTCPDCGDYVHPTQTLCEGCGSRLTPTNSNGSGRSDLDGTSAAGAERRTIPMVKDCTCGGNGICTACVLAEYDRDPFAQALEHAVDVVTRPANVVELPRFSKNDREPTDNEIYNRHGVEGGIAYTVDVPGSLGENDWRL